MLIRNTNLIFRKSFVLEPGKIDGVIIATPAETHYRLAHEALLAGKHVYLVIVIWKIHLKV